eukprot:gene34756-42868_t
MAWPIYALFFNECTPCRSLQGQAAQGLSVHGDSDQRLTHALPMGMRLAIDGQEIQASVAQTGSQRLDVRVGDALHTLDVVSLGAHEARFILDRVMQHVAFERDAHSLWLLHAGHPYQVVDRTRQPSARQGEAGGDGKVRASMNGRVVAVLVTVGERVQAKQPLVTLEAMKMEHVHAAPASGTVVALPVATGDRT